ncbi:MAG TPA: hypothetical protein VF808_10855 [Ktedonobacterales bacterium]
MRPLRITLVVIGIVQIFFGLPFLVAPGLYSVMLSLSSAPAWTSWFFVMSGARFLGMAYGMFLAARDPVKHVAWINAMIAVQAFDWLGTIYSIATGAITFAQATDAPFLPLIFIAALLIWYPRGARASENRLSPQRPSA